MTPLAAGPCLSREPQSKLLAQRPKYFCSHHCSLHTTRSCGNPPKYPQTITHITNMADALKAEGNKLFAEKKFAESM